MLPNNNTNHKFFLKSSSTFFYPTHHKRQSTDTQSMKLSSLNDSDSKLLSTTQISKFQKIRNQPKRENLHIDIMKISTKSNPSYSRDLNMLKQDVQSRIQKQRFLFANNERSDMFLLNQWIYEMLNQARSNNQNLPFFSYYMDLVSIYTGAISEIGRVVSMHCKEQAILMQNIWDDHLKVVVEYIKKVEDHNLNIDLNSVKEVSRVHDQYRAYFEKIQTKQSQFLELEDQYKNQIAGLQRENTYLRRKEIRREKELQQLMKQYEQVLHTNQNLSNELAILINQQKQFEKASDPTEDLHKRVSFIAQAQFLLTQFSLSAEQDQKEEEALQQNQNIIQYYENVIFKDQSCDTFDLIIKRSFSTDTSEFITYKNKEVQAVKYLPTYSTFVQVGSQMQNAYSQTDFQKIEKVEKSEVEEEIKLPPINYYTLIQYANQYTMKQIVRSFENLSFPIQIDEKYAAEVPLIFQSQMSLFQESVKSLFLFLVHQETQTKEDVLELYEYITINSESIRNFFAVIWELLERFSTRFQDQLIEAYERKLDYDAIQIKLKFNVALYKKLYEKYKEIKLKIAADPEQKTKNTSRKVKQFTQKLKEKIKIINSFRLNNKTKQPANELFLNVKPDQYMISQNQQMQSTINNMNNSQSDNQLMQEPQPRDKLSNFGFIVEPSKEDDWKLDDDKDFKQSVTLLPSQQNLDSIKSIPRLKLRKNAIDGSILQTDQSFNETQSSSKSLYSVRNLKLELEILKPKLIFEKRFRIKKISSRHAEIATTHMKNILKKFHTHQINGILQEKTVLKHISSYLYIYLKRVNVQGINAIVVPFYIHCFEQFFQQGGMQPLAGAKFERFIKSILYYRHNERITLFAKFLTGEYDSQDFNFYVSMMQYFDEAKGTGLGLFRSSSDDYLYVNMPKLAFVNKLFLYTNADNIYYQIDSLKQTSIINATRYIIEFDSMCTILMKVYQEDRKKQNSSLVDVFNAIDIDRIEMIHFEDFKLLCGISQIDQFLTANSIPQFFISVNQSSFIVYFQESDFIENGEKMMSLSRFIIICNEFEFFEEKEIQQLLSGYIRNKSSAMEELKQLWPGLRRNAKLQQIQSSDYNQTIRKICIYLDNFFASKQASISESQIRQAAIMMKIVENSARNRILDYYTQIFGFPEQFKYIQNITQQFLVKKYTKEEQK